MSAELRDKIARLRRDMPKNQTVMDVCDAAEAWVSGRRYVPPAVEGESEAQRRRRLTLERVRRHRAKKTNPFEEG